MTVAEQVPKMKTRTVLVALSICALAVVAAVVAWRHSRSNTPTKKRPTYDMSLCAFDHVPAGGARGICDDADGIEVPVPNCELTKKVRSYYRSKIRWDVQTIQFDWATVLLNSNVISDLETGDIEFTPELGQKIFDVTYGATNVGKVPKAPKDRLAFIEALKCSPRDWAISQTQWLNQYQDVQLAKMIVDLPEPVTIQPRIEAGLSFLHTH